MRAVSTILLLLLLVPLTLAVHLWLRRKRLMRDLRRHNCPVCGNSFDDAIATYEGVIGDEDKARLDNFQKRFARYRIRCHDCGAVVVCTDDATPMRGWFDEG